MTGPLSGLRVVVLAGMGPVPFASMLLADMGADVVRISRPANRPARVEVQSAALPAKQDVVNRGVRAVPVDLKSRAGVETALRLCDVADVFVEGFRPGVIERLGLAPQRLLERNPALVVARLTGYGQVGDLAHAAGHDINYVAQSGALNAFRSSEGVPHPPLNLLGDYAGGGALAALGILAAVLQVRTSGRGQVIDAAMVDGVALLTAKIQGLRAAGLFSDDHPDGNYLAGAAPFYRVYECADGRYVAVGALESDFYQEFISRLGADVSNWPDQNDRGSWAQLHKLIEDVIATRTMAEWAEVYAGTDACVTPVLTFSEAAEHSHNAQRLLYHDVNRALHPAPAPRFEMTPSRHPQEPAASSLDAEALLAQWSANCD